MSQSLVPQAAADPLPPDVMTQLVALRHALHRQPEVSGQERDTAMTIRAALEALEPDSLLFGLGGHGVVAVFDSGKAGPCIGLRCELDALPIPEEGDRPYRSQRPGFGHLCGHDGHMAMIMGVAHALAAQRPERGRVALIFQPAEETGAGAAAMVAEPDVRALSLDMVLSLHNLPGLALGAVELCRHATNCASRGARVRLWGRTAHASAPEDGLSPAAAMARLMPRLAALGRGGDLGDTGYALSTLTHVSLGEATFGIAPGVGELWVTLRTRSDSRMGALVEALEQEIAQEATAAGLRHEISYCDVFDACTNHPNAVALLERACAGAGVPLTLSDRPKAFSEDFGQFAALAPSAMFWLGSGVDQPKLHNPDFDFPDPLIGTGVSIFMEALSQFLGA